MKILYTLLPYIGFNMKITYDKEADAMYIELSTAPFAKNKEVDSRTILDLDSKGNVLGIELLDVSKRIPPKELLLHVKNLKVVAE